MKLAHYSFKFMLVRNGENVEDEAFTVTFVRPFSVDTESDNHFMKQVAVLEKAHIDEFWDVELISIVEMA